MTEKLAHTPDDRDFIAELKRKVQAAQVQAARAVNTELIALYWAIGRRIMEKQHASGLGRQCDRSHRPRFDPRARRN